MVSFFIDDDLGDIPPPPFLLRGLRPCECTPDNRPLGPPAAKKSVGLVEFELICACLGCLGSCCPVLGVMCDDLGRSWSCLATVLGNVEAVLEGVLEYLHRVSFRIVTYSACGFREVPVRRMDLAQYWECVHLIRNFRQPPHGDRITRGDSCSSSMVPLQPPGDRITQGESCSPHRAPFSPTPVRTM